jgi:succinate dehydrogenase/fumarate reductase-like Fe-S protein
MLQYLVVGLIVLLAAIYAGRKYLPAALRKRLVWVLTRRGDGQSKLVKWLDTEASCGSGCDTCKACDTSAPAAPPGEGKHRVISLRVEK